LNAGVENKEGDRYSEVEITLHYLPHQKGSIAMNKIKVVNEEELIRRMKNFLKG
jgi:hypothetical protein